ncbi:ABC transporter permease, partial [Salmonella enterica subsp. enterica serovar Anatum]
VEVIFGLVFLQPRLYLIVLLLVNFLLVKFYIKMRLK